MRFAYSALSLSIFAALSTSVFAENLIQDTQNSQTEASIKLNTIVIEAKANNAIGTTVYTDEQLKNMPNSKKSISDFLKTNSNVQFQRDALNGSTQASLAPENFSINGAKYYDNKFVVNGVNTSNSLDPISRADAFIYGTPSQNQTANINTDLLCELEVIDSNASAEQGDFLGGVISAKTCAPKTNIGEVHGSITYDYTTDAWSRFNFIDAIEEDTSENIPTISTSAYHKEYVTQGISANLYSKLNEQFSINGFVARRQSDLPLTSQFTPVKKVDTTEKNDNYGMTLYYNPTENSRYQFGIEHYTYNKSGFSTKNINSDYTLISDATTYRIATEHDLPHAKLEQNLSYRESQYNRKQDQNHFASWNYQEGSKDWNPAQGSQLEGNVGGTMLTKQNNLNYDFKVNFKAINFGKTQHTFKTGLNYQHNEGILDRPVAYEQYTLKTAANNLVCADGDYLCASGAKGQYITSGTIYSAGYYSARQDQAAIYVEDKIQWNKFTTYLGLRADYESLASNINIAPRSNFEYRPFTNDLLKLQAGLNRYYGVTYLRTELDKQVYANSIKATRVTTDYSDSWNSTNNYGWNYSKGSDNGGILATDLKTPYSDEKVFSISSDFKNLALQLKWVNREFKDQIRSTLSTPKTFLNQDGGQADTYTLNISNIQPIPFFNTQHTVSLGLSYVAQETVNATYNAVNVENTFDNTAYLDGKFYTVGTLPTQDAPFTARLNWTVTGLNTPFKLNNFFYYRSPSINNVLVAKDQVIQGIDNVWLYEKENFSSKFNWDTRATYDYKIAQNQNLTFGLTVTNVLNKHNKAINTSGSPYSEEGRRFIADLTYKF